MDFGTADRYAGSAVMGTIGGVTGLSALAGAVGFGKKKRRVDTRTPLQKLTPAQFAQLTDEDFVALGVNPKLLPFIDRTWKGRFTTVLKNKVVEATEGAPIADLTRRQADGTPTFVGRFKGGVNRVELEGPTPNFSRSANFTKRYS